MDVDQYGNGSLRDSRLLGKVFDKFGISSRKALQDILPSQDLLPRPRSGIGSPAVVAFVDDESKS